MKSPSHKEPEAVMTEKQELRLEDKTSIAEVMANQLCEEFIDRIILLCIVAKDEISIQRFISSCKDRLDIIMKRK